MPRKKRKSKGQRDKSGEGTQVNLYSCSNFQLGPNNSMAINDTTIAASQTLYQIQQGSNEAGLVIVNSILRRRIKGLTLSQLGETIQEELRESSSTKSFREIAGKSVEEFLKCNNSVFELSGRCQDKIVHLRGTDKKGEIQGTSGEILQNAAPCESMIKDYVSTEIDDIPITPSDTNDIFHSDVGIIDSTTGPDEPTWVEVKRKRSRSSRMQNIENVGKSSFDEKTVHFKHIIERSETTDLKFVEDSCAYMTSPLACMLDIVSMWNTPTLRKSYIVIGVQALKAGNVPKGVSKGFDDAYWKALFAENLFTMTPIYTWQEIRLKSGLFYLIEVKCSRGHGQPSIVKKDMKEGKINLFKDDIWYRNERKNTVCKPSDKFTASIYEWFSHPNLVNPNVLYHREKINTSCHDPGQTVKDCSHSQVTASKCKAFRLFWEKVNGFKKGSFILVSAGMSNKEPGLNHLGLLPWLAVYDFDVFSYSTGLLNALQDVIDNERNLQIRTWKEVSPPLSETGTLWCFLRGRKEIEDSRTDMEDGNVENVREWSREIKSGLQEQCEKLANFSEDCSPLTIVMIWPANEELVPHVCKFIDKLFDNLSYQPTIVLVQETQPQTSSGESRLNVLRDEFKDSLNVIQIRLVDLFQGISNHFSTKKSGQNALELPNAESPFPTTIGKKDANWLNEDFEVLYLNNPYVDSDDELDEKISTFFKGGSLAWPVWYKFGQGEVEIERDIFERLSSTIEPHLGTFRTYIINLIHAPGSGGSTLAKRILWKFHTRVPCMHLKLGTTNRSKDIVQKVTFVHQCTRTPILMLIDGGDASQVKYLSNALPYTVILYVKRYPYQVQVNLPKNKVYVTGTVSTKEARMLATRYGERSDVDKKRALECLTADVQKGQPHLLFEFGMTVYHHEFKGIRAYVKGYLELSSNPRHDLLPWQKCVAYLALVYYYSQSSVPCQFFATLFGKPANYAMTLTDDFPYPLTEFVVNDTNDKRKNNIRICHFAVAREILEQILSRSAMDSREERTGQLSLHARRNLAKLCKDLIEYAKKKNGRSPLSSIVRLILARTFIFRDEKDMGENQVRKRHVLSTLIIDIPADQPLFTERLQILEKLVSSFPDDPSFHAHLGRFYAFCRNDEENKVEKHFKEAVRLCEKLSKGRSVEEIDDGTKSTMTHVYHMYGIVKQRYLCKYTGRSQNEETDQEKTEASFFTTIAKLVDEARLSCHYFLKSRQLTPETRDVYTYAYTGEIQVRLQMCEYVKRFFTGRSDHGKEFEAFFYSKADETSKAFIKEGIQIIEYLIHECYTDVELSRDDTNTLRKLVSSYNELFKTQIFTFETNEEDMDNGIRRTTIALMKLKYATKSNFGEIESIKDGKAVQEIVRLYKNIIDEDQYLYGSHCNFDKKKLDHDYREWIVAIRHEEFPENYSLEEVLLYVQRWHELVRSPTSTLYLFILQSLLGFDTETKQGNTECIVIARETMEDMKKMNRLIIRPKYPREWLGCHPGGIKMLVSGNRHVGMCPEEREGNGPSMTGVKVCKGTIRHPNTNSLGGYIEYNMAISNVTVFFIPTRVKLVGARFAGRRVQFNLAFSVEIGYEAFHVKLLKRHACPSCRNVLEFASSENVRQCSCGSEVYKDQVNEVDHDPEP